MQRAPWDGRRPGGTFRNAGAGDQSDGPLSPNRCLDGAAARPPADTMSVAG